MGINRLTEWTAPGATLRVGKSEPKRNRKGTRRVAEWDEDRAVDLVPEEEPDASVRVDDAPERTLLQDWQAVASEEERELDDDLGLERAGTTDDDNAQKPGERLGVRGVSRYAAWGDSQQRGEIVLTSGSLEAEAAALSCMAVPVALRDGSGIERDRRDRYDVRPAMLLLFHAQDLSQLEAVLRYGIGYLTAWCDRYGVLSKTLPERKSEAIRWAVADGLARLYGARQPRQVLVGIRQGTTRLNVPAKDTRAVMIGVRKESFAELVDQSMLMFETRLHEARRRFAPMVQGAEPKARRYGETPQPLPFDGWWNERNSLRCKRANNPRGLHAKWGIQHPPNAIMDRQTTLAPLTNASAVVVASNDELTPRALANR